MTKLTIFKEDLELQLMERELELLRMRAKRLQTSLTPTINELEESEYVRNVPVNEGPEYLTVLSSIWEKPFLTLEDGTAVKCLDEARRIAKSRGLKGISIITKGTS